MNVTAVVSVDQVAQVGPSDMLAAFVGGEIRGIAAPTFVEARPFFFLTVYANTNGESISFQYYSGISNEVHGISEGLEFETNAIVGQVNDPLSFAASCEALTTSTEEWFAAGGQLSQNFPNPFKINYDDSFFHTLCRRRHVDHL